MLSNALVIDMTAIRTLSVFYSSRFISVVSEFVAILVVVRLSVSLLSSLAHFSAFYRNSIVISCHQLNMSLSLSLSHTDTRDSIDPLSSSLIQPSVDFIDGLNLDLMRTSYLSTGL